jgi:predicted PurR-regulated permease PerM
MTDSKNIKHTVDISVYTILKIVAAIGFAWLLSHIVNILIIVFVSVILTSAIRPLAKTLHKKGIPQTLSNFIVIFGFVGVLGTALYFGITPLITETGNFVTELAKNTDKLKADYGIDIPINSKDWSSFIGKNTQTNGAAGTVINFGKTLIDTMLSTLALVALTFYQLAEENKVKDFVSSLFPNRNSQIKELISRSEIKLGQWFRGQVSLMFYVGTLTYLFVLGVSLFSPEMFKFALPLAVIAGVLEIVPVLGPTLALIPAVLISYSISLPIAIVMFVGYIGIQQVESNVIIPKVMNKAVGIDPILVIVGILIGSNLMGPIGSLLSVPVMAVISVLFEEWQVGKL